jgi:SAM-dependent methyltransferase
VHGQLCLESRARPTDHLARERVEEEERAGMIVGSDAQARVQGRNLLLVGFLVLFMELAFIRWFAANVIFLQFFTNVVLMACFLGMSCGCLAARQQRDWLAQFPMMAMRTVVAALVALAVYKSWTGLNIDVGGQVSPQEVFFGTEYRDPDVAQFTVPIEAIIATFFILITLTFVGLGQVLGRAFDAYPQRLHGYVLNIVGSIAGIVAFSILSFLQTPAVVWFVVCCTGIGYLLHQRGALTRIHTVAMTIVVLAVMLPPIVTSVHSGRTTYWSPYYTVEFDKAQRGVGVDNIGHQQMIPMSEGGSTYSLIHLLHKSTTGAPFDDVLIIGSGTGNDLAHALRFGVSRIDAVEIDPVIQSIGIRENPHQAYQDPRVIRHLDDGRHFLRTTDQKYDLVVYALVDSLVLHSGYANIRLESYLFTEEAFEDIRRVLKPGGTFVTYNFFRQGWIVERVAAMAETAFGCKPIVLTFPYQKELKASEASGYSMIIGGCNPQLAEKFAQYPTFWMNKYPERNIGVDGFALQPETLPVGERVDWLPIAPLTLIYDRGTPEVTTDDWPFLYLKGRLIPDINIRSMLLLGALGLGMVYLFLPKGEGRVVIDTKMFFLGAAFMLLETRAVVQLALLFGSTWLVNSMVFFTVLVLVLLGNMYVLKVQNSRVTWHYVGLLALLAAGAVIPAGEFLGDSIAFRYGLPSLLALGPMFFAAVIFASLFRDSENPDISFGSNIAGAVVGGLCESLSMLVGFRYLLVLAAIFYLLSAWSSIGRAAKAPAGA